MWSLEQWGVNSETDLQEVGFLFRVKSHQSSAMKNAGHRRVVDDGRAVGTSQHARLRSGLLPKDRAREERRLDAPQSTRARGQRPQAVDATGPHQIRMRND